jgi:hypothetical protein
MNSIAIGGFININVGNVGRGYQEPHVVIVESLVIEMVIL